MVQGEFHIHIDATEMPAAFEQYALSQGFHNSNFEGHPDGYLHFEPNRHMTLKPKDKFEFRTVFDALKSKAQELGLIGYIEGEKVISDVQIGEKPFVDALPMPFKVERRLLLGPNPDPAKDEPFRETEFHLVLDKDASDPRLIKKLLDSGLYGAYIKKKGGYVALTLTIQGKRTEIDPLAGSLWAYLNDAGGAVRATLQEERAIAYYLVGIDYKKLPEVAGIIHYATSDMLERGKTAVELMRAQPQRPVVLKSDVPLRAASTLLSGKN